MRQVQIFIKHEQADQVYQAVSNSPFDEWVHRLMVFEGYDHTQIRFVCPTKHMSSVLNELDQLGIGDTFGEVDVVPLATLKPILLNQSKARRSTIRQCLSARFDDRMTIEEIYSVIDEATHLTFDFLLNTFYAAMIAAVGLASDSSPTVVASMLISPLMGPIMGFTFGFAVRDWVFVRRCAKNLCCGALVTVGTGMLVGAVVAMFYGPYCKNYSINPDHWCFGDALVSNEVDSRGTATGLLVGLFIALPAGGAGALALMGNGNAALVGVGIAVALLPPLVNSGLLFAMSVVYYFEPPVVLTHQERHEFQMCAYSFLLFCLNFSCIFVMAYSMFKLKKIHKLPLRSTKWRTWSENLSKSRKRSTSSGRGRGNKVKTPVTETKAPRARRQKRRSFDGTSMREYRLDDSTRSLDPTPGSRSRRLSDEMHSPLLGGNGVDSALGLNDSMRSIGGLNDSFNTNNRSFKSQAGLGSNKGLLGSTLGANSPRSHTGTVASQATNRQRSVSSNHLNMLALTNPTPRMKSPASCTSQGPTTQS